MREAPPILTPTADGRLAAADLERVVEALRAGQIVALPTETVYGLAVRADDDASLARLVQVKGAPQDRPFTLHVADGGRVAGAVELEGVVRRLTERYWPGPLTLVVRDREGDAPALAGGRLALDGWTGVRAPAHPATESVLAAVDVPVVMTSANRAGDAPATDAGTVAETFGADEVTAIVDGDKTAIGQASTVLAVGRGRFEVLREGIVTAADLRATGGLRILFVCTGNTCRSPMAETIARAALASALGTDDPGAFGFDIASRGVYAGPGAPASENAVTAMADRGLDLSGHGSAPVDAREIAAADRVYCLTASHRAALLDALPPRAGAHVELLDPAGGDVPDPFGGPLDVYRATADAIQAMVVERLGDWV